LKTDTVLRFIALVPHRDSGRLLRAYSRRLFAAGLAGAFSFPGVAPLAVVSRPFTVQELKDLAVKLRGLSSMDGRDGKIATEKAGTVAYPDSLGTLGTGLFIFGPVLDVPVLPLAAFPLDTVVYRFPLLILCAALAGKNDRVLIDKAHDIPAAPSFFFRAAALTNMVLRPLSKDGESFEWKTGVSRWLPPYRREER
jgi:hypothetical protein